MTHNKQSRQTADKIREKCYAMNVLQVRGPTLFCTLADVLINR